MQYDEITSPRLQDGYEVYPGERIRHKGAEVTYMGASRREWTMIVVVDDNGDHKLADPDDCRSV